MKRKTTIQKIIAGFLVVVFTITATPKLYFHSLFTSHTDVTVCKEPNKAPVHLHQHAFNCHFDNLPLTVPYLLYNTQLSFGIKPQHPQQTATRIFAYKQSWFFHQESRGPPAA